VIRANTVLRYVYTHRNWQVAIACDRGNTVNFNPMSVSIGDSENWQDGMAEKLECEITVSKQISNLPRSTAPTLFHAPEADLSGFGQKRSVLSFDVNHCPRLKIPVLAV